jgi:hypothetical protein
MVRMAVDFFIFPEAMGRLDFRGWSLSSSRSFRSLKIYKALEIRQNALKAMVVFKRRGRLKIFWEKIKAA